MKKFNSILFFWFFILFIGCNQKAVLANELSTKDSILIEIDSTSKLLKSLKKINSFDKKIFKLYIKLLPGKYILNDPINIDSRKIKSFVIEGSGIKNTAIWIKNKSGGLIINAMENNKATYEIRNLSFIAGQKNSGTAVSIRQISKGNQHRRNVIIENIEIGIAKNNSDYFFKKGIVLYGVWRALIDNVLMTGPYGPKLLYPYQTEACFDIEESYSPTITNSRCWVSQIGINYTSKMVKGAPEALNINNSNIVQVNKGIVVDFLSSEPGLNISDNHINAREIGIHIKNRKFGFIRNNLMYRDRNSIEYIDILLENSRAIIVESNIFQYPNPKGSDNGISIFLNQTDDSIISNNIFNSKGVGIQVIKSKNNFFNNNKFIDTKLEKKEF